MARYTVWFGTMASRPLSLDVNTDGLDKDEARDKIIDEAWAKFEPPNICHHCSREFDLADFEPDEKQITGLDEGC